MALHLILLGPPASGKGTQGRRIAESKDLDYLSTGALLREVLATKGPEADEIRPILNRGGYIPDERMCAIMRDWLEKHPGGWVLDGFPRTLTQDDFLEDWLRSRGERIDAAVALEVPKEELIRRIKDRVECPDCRWSGQSSDLSPSSGCPQCGGPAAPRSDDSLENFLRRHHEYSEQTIPVIEKYAASGCLLRCAAVDGIEAVAKTIQDSLINLINDGQTP